MIISIQVRVLSFSGFQDVDERTNLPWYHEYKILIF